MEIPDSFSQESAPPPPSYNAASYPPTQQQQQPFYANTYGQPASVTTYQVVGVPQTTVIVQPQRWFPLSKTPVSMNCPQCNARIITRVTRQTGGGTWLVSGGICLAGCVFPVLWFGCCLIPFCIDDCKDASHHWNTYALVKELSHKLNCKIRQIMNYLQKLNDNPIFKINKPPVDIQSFDL